ncbi:MAG: DUF5685 family protein [Myxococcota bacterium]
MMGYLRPIGADAGHRALLAGYLCGLCHHVGETYGFAYRLFAGPDVAFYNLFLDVAGEGVAAEGRRACVLAPGPIKLRCRDATENTRIAAAFGVWMAVAKLEDDRRDEGGWLRWLACRAFSAGGRKAREILREAGFPVEAIEARMAEQARVEAAGPLPLEDAAAPTAAIARLAFGFAGHAAAGDVGEGIGRYLFFMDNLLDYGRDVRKGGYNALAAAFGAADELPEAARRAGVEGARGEIAALRGAIARLPVRGDAAWLSRVLVAGFADKVRRWEALPRERLAVADLKDVTPRLNLSQLATRIWTQQAVRLRVAFAFLLAWIAPRSARAQEWWPEDTGALELDTGTVDPVVASAHGEDAPVVLCDAFAGNCGWVDLEGCCSANCIDPCCGNVDCCSSSSAAP